MGTQIQNDQLYIIPSAKVYRSSDQTYANGATDPLSFDSEEWDTDSIHEGITNPERLTCKTAGLYLITANIRFASNSTNKRQLRIKKVSGATTTIIANESCDGNGYTSLSASGIVRLEVNDYIWVEPYQNSGGDLAVSYASDQPASCSIVKLGN